MPIQLGGDVFFSQRELADLGIRKFFESVRLGTEYFVAGDDVAASTDLSLKDFSPKPYLPFDEARLIVGLSVDDFRDFIMGDEFAPRVSPVVYRNCWYVPLEDLKPLDPRFDTESFMTLAQAAKQLETDPEILEPFLTDFDTWPEPVDGKVYVRRERVEVLSKCPPFDHERFLSIYEASVELKVETTKLREQALRGRFAAKQAGAEWYITRKTLEELRDETK